MLQALARDGVLPRSLRFLGQGTRDKDEPRIGTAVTLGIAIAIVFIGDLNLIAPILTMFFLTTYLVLNVAAGIEGFLQSPSFRPSFRVHWSLSLLGAIGCLAAMFLINAIATVVAALIVLGIYLWLERRELEANWGDVRRGIWMEVLRAGLFQVGREDDTRNWRPHLLVLSGAPSRRWLLVELANSLVHNRGFVTVATVLPRGSRSLAQQEEMEQRIHEYLERRGIQALVRTLTAPDPFEGAMRLAEIYGIGSLVPNTILLGDSEDPTRRDRYCEMITTLHEGRRNVIILRDNPELGFARRQRIDVWWGGLYANGGLMLLLADLLQTDVLWRHAEIHMKLVVPDGSAAEAAKANLDQVIQTLRLSAVPQVLIANGRLFSEILHESSEDTDLILLGVATPHENFVEYYANLQQWTQGLPTTLLVLAAPKFSYAKVFSEDAPAVE